MATRRQRTVAVEDAELRHAAEVVVGDPERYGGESSLMVRSSRALLRRLDEEKGGFGRGWKGREVPMETGG